MKWLFLVHQVQTSNSRERVKVWRLTKKVGAVLYRNSVYVLPSGKEHLENFQWLCQQIKDSKGEASVFETESTDEHENAEIRSLFNRMREADFKELLNEADRINNRILRLRESDQKTRRTLEKEFLRLQQFFWELDRMDFFGSPQKQKVRVLLNMAKRNLTTRSHMKVPHPPPKEYGRRAFKGRLWSTRKHIHIDRLCSAWLIRKFIDQKARFAFAPESHLPKNSIPFDVIGAEFSHRGEDCTFETLLKAFRLRDSTLSKIAQIVHDVDIKDNKFDRPEAAGLDLLIRALSESLENDHKVLEIGSIILDSLYFQLSKEKSLR